jgi:RNA polymerase sigma factor (TIGR02999 family)
MSDITRLLDSVASGDPRAATELLPLVYDELRKLAAARLAQETPGQTLQATALVHEAYLRLVKSNPDQEWNGRSHFFAAAAEAMRRILIDAARHRKALRHGGAGQRCSLLEADLSELPGGDDLLDFDEALTELAAVDPRAAELVKLRVFAGVTLEEAARFQGVSTRTAKRTWAYARAWLGRRLGAPDQNS